MWRGPAEIEIPFSIGDQVLELGCGNGKTLQALRSASAVIALDFSPEAVALCSRNLDFKEVGFVVGDVRHLPFVQNWFDSVFCIHVLEHLSANDRTQMSQEAERVLKPGGSLFVRAFSSSDMRASKGELVEKGTRRRGDGIAYHYFTEEELNSVFKTMTMVSMQRVASKKRFKGRDFTREVFDLVLLKPHL